MTRRNERVTSIVPTSLTGEMYPCLSTVSKTELYLKVQVKKRMVEASIEFRPSKKGPKNKVNLKILLLQVNKVKKEKIQNTPNCEIRHENRAWILKQNLENSFDFFKYLPKYNEVNTKKLRTQINHIG